MGAAANLIGLELTGSRSGQKWTPTKKMSFEPGVTPGAFSVGYEVIDSEGNAAFLKASDLTMAFGAKDPVEALLQLTQAHSFERDILDHCRGNRLNKIVTAIDSGTEQIVTEGVRDVVFYIVFELADGDLRKFVSAKRGNDLVWVLSAAHNFAVAMAQIHGVNVFHNDFKPGNALVFCDTEKISDLGRAASSSMSAAHSNYVCAGDPRFAPPEQLYHIENPSLRMDQHLRAKAGDLYNLGSVFHFLVTKRMVTSEVLIRLDPHFRPQHAHGGWTDSYESALPHWRQQYEALISEFSDDLPSEWSENFVFAISEMRDLVLHLCDPDLRLRGDQSSNQPSHSKYSLEKIISKLDSLRNRVMVLSRGK
jgi:serine/threonine protein kinase